MITFLSVTDEGGRLKERSRWVVGGRFPHKMDHSVKAMDSHRKLVFSRLVDRQRFENDELEALYQRYIFKLQHSSVSSVVCLFLLLSALLANLSFVYTRSLTPQNIYHLLHCLLFLFLLVFLSTRWTSISIYLDSVLKYLIKCTSEELLLGINP